MLRLIRGMVAESLGIGGLLWLALQIGGTDEAALREPIRPAPPARYSAALTLAKPPVAEEADWAERPTSATFFRGTDSLLGRHASGR